MNSPKNTWNFNAKVPSIQAAPNTSLFQLTVRAVGLCSEVKTNRPSSVTAATVCSLASDRRCFAALFLAQKQLAKHLLSLNKSAKRRFRVTEDFYTSRVIKCTHYYYYYCRKTRFERCIKNNHNSMITTARSAACSDVKTNRPLSVTAATVCTLASDRRCFAALFLAQKQLARHLLSLNKIATKCFHSS